jgi:hypothetical protein
MTRIKGRNRGSPEDTGRHQHLDRRLGGMRFARQTKNLARKQQIDDV